MRSTSSCVKRTCTPAFDPPACSLVRPGNTPIMFVPNCAKIFSNACPNPAPYASSNTTVAMPHAIPTIVISVRRRLCFIASIACPRIPLSMVLFLSQCFHRSQHSRLPRWVKASHNSAKSQRSHRHRRRPWHQSRRIKPHVVISHHRTEYGHQSRRTNNPDQSTQRRQRQSLKKELEENAAIRCTQCLSQTNLLGPLSHRHQHDVDNPHRTQRQCHNSHAPKKHIHCSEDQPNHAV